MRVHHLLVGAQPLQAVLGPGAGHCGGGGGGSGRLVVVAGTAEGGRPARGGLHQLGVRRVAVLVQHDVQRLLVDARLVTLHLPDDSRRGRAVSTRTD